MSLAPIILFVYNRPWHTRRTIEALQKNFLANESELIIFADGPKGPEDRAGVDEVRGVIRDVDGFKSVVRVEQERNRGLAASIIAGVTEVVNRHGRVIVLEDDLVTSPWFLTYMNEALERYEAEDRVMHIAGYMYPIEREGLGQTFFYRASSCWGWGTWRCAWAKFEPDLNILVPFFDRKMKRRFNIDGAYDFWDHIELNLSARIRTWAIKWYASVFLQGGLCLHPAQSLVQNIGHDASGTHCGPNSDYDVAVSEDRVTEFETKLSEDPLALERIREFLARPRPFRRRLMSILGKFFKGRS